MDPLRLFNRGGQRAGHHRRTTKSAKQDETNQPYENKKARDVKKETMAGTLRRVAGTVSLVGVMVVLAHNMDESRMVNVSRRNGTR